MAFGAISTPAATNPDTPVVQTPSDTVSCLKLSPASLNPKMYLASTSWDSQLCVWEVDPSSGQTRPSASMKCEAPLLWCSWSNDGQVIYSAGADNKVHAFHLPSQQKMIVGSHDAGVRNVYYCGETPSACVVSGGWDKKVKFWDVGGGGKQLGVIELPERVFSMDVKGSMCVVGMAEKKIQVYDLRNPGKVVLEKISQLRHQTRVVTCFGNQSGFIVGSVEGRVSVDHLNEDKRKLDYAFKCRDQQQPLIWPVHCACFYPAPNSGVFATGSGGGSCYFWNKDEKSKLKSFTGLNEEGLTACDFSNDGKIFAYSVGYDWSKGADSFNPSAMTPKIYLHAVVESDLTNKRRSSRR